MSFSLFPPEFNTELVYSARGSGQLSLAASAWDALAAGLCSTASSLRPAISALIANWPGPSVLEIAGAVAQYASWLNATAAQVAAVAAKAAAAADALETAFAMTVPSPVIEANRAWFRKLAKTNVLGQDALAVAATEAHYLEMWAQDAATMNGYMAAWRDALTMSAYGKATATTNATDSSTSQGSAPAGSSGPAAPTCPSGEVRWARNSLTTAAFAPGAGGQLGSPNAASTTTDTADAVDTASAPERLATYPIRMLTQASEMFETGAAMLTSKTEGSPTALRKCDGLNVELTVGGVTDRLNLWASAVSAQIARATSLSGLSIPPRWAATAAGLRHVTLVLPTADVAPPSRRRVDHAVVTPTHCLSEHSAARTTH